jgi:hypothetical protein
VGNIASSYSVIASEAPIKYRSAWITVIVSMAFTTLASLVLRWMYVRENKRRDALAENKAGAETPGVVSGGEKEVLAGAEVEGDDDKARDLTDWENKAFRYAL